MKRHFSIGSLSCVILACATTFIFAKDPPTSAEQLRRELESAFENKDVSAIISLICWDGVDSSMKIMKSGMMAEEISRGRTNKIIFTLTPLPTNFQTTVTSFLPDWQGDNGRCGKYNIPVIGMIRMNHIGNDPKDKYPDVPYGKKNDAFYISQLISYQIPGKALNVRVDNIPGFLTYTGYWVHVQNGKDITIPITDQTNEFRQGWGDYVKYCLVQRTSKETGVGNYFEFKITEDRTNIIFESGQITNELPVIYERKQ